MPNRKSTSSEASPLSSVRRLSSLASFQTLNPFNRRRSNNATDSTTTSSSSKTSISSTVANAPQPYKTSAALSQYFQAADAVAEEAPASVPFEPELVWKRSSYVCLPDDPIGGMPRSRTCSNLPIPTQTRRKTPILPSTTHTRLSSVALLSSRLPSPSASTRKYSAGSSSSADQKAPMVNNRIKRSGTEPFLPLNAQHSSMRARSTAFKENISLSPVKPLPSTYTAEALDCSRFSFQAQHGGPSLPRHASRLVTQDDLRNAVPAPYHARHTASLQVQSSPAYQTGKARAPTRGHAGAGLTPVQRWQSQPTLTSKTNALSPRHGEIQQRRLLSERQPPTPPARSPTGIRPSNHQRLRNSTTISHLRRVSEQSPSKGVSAIAVEHSQPFVSHQEVCRVVREFLSASANSSQVNAAEPSAYWCGRFSALVDRYRNEELATYTGAWKAESDKMHSPEATTKRMRRALEHLAGLCKTEEARESFVKFQLQLAALNNNPDLARPTRVHVLDRRMERQESVDSESSTTGSGTTISEVRKTGFMNRLLGRNRRSLNLS